MRNRPPIGVALLCSFLVAAAAFAQPVDAGPSDDLVSGIAAYNGGDFAAARNLLQGAADRGEPEAMVNLGYMYARGQGVPADPAYALQLYWRAAEAGDGEGMNAVGYRFNFAATPDLARAIHWYCLAIGRGNPRAMNNLAILAYDGRGLDRDRDEARSLWSQASARGELGALANLGVDLWSDTTLPVAERQAGYAMVRDAALHGGAFAQQVLRRQGDSEAFPPATITALTMRLEPRDGQPGATRICGEVIS